MSKTDKKFVKQTNQKNYNLVHHTTIPQGGDWLE